MSLQICGVFAGDYGSTRLANRRIFDTVKCEVLPDVHSFLPPRHNYIVKKHENEDAMNANERLV